MRDAPVVLVTGASSGIGLAIAREYARRGARLALLARRLDRLQALAAELGDRAVAIACDVTVDGDPERAVGEALAAFGRIDVAIANAGVGVDSAIDKLTVEGLHRHFETNVYGALRTVKAVLGPLRASRGRLAITGSVMGFLALPRAAAYNMSKAAVRALAETLSSELAGDGVSVTHIAPGFVESELRTTDRAGRPMKDPVPAFLVMPSATAARQIVDAVTARRPEVMITRHAKAAVFLARHASGVVGAALRLAAPRMARSSRR